MRQRKFEDPWRRTRQYVSHLSIFLLLFEPAQAIYIYVICDASTSDDNDGWPADTGGATGASIDSDGGSLAPGSATVSVDNSDVCLVATGTAVSAITPLAPNVSSPT